MQRTSTESLDTRLDSYSLSVMSFFELNRLFAIGVDFHAKSVGRTGTVFESIDLSDKEWTEYDEEGDLSVSVMELEYKIE